MRTKLIAMLFGLALAAPLAKANTPPDPQPIRPDEGMWLPLLIKTLNYSEMQAMGCRLSADEIYSINQASVKDAIVRLNGGSCTAEVVSKEGLVLTNHHCAFDAIQSQSSVETDYLTKGFWAMTREQEIPLPGSTCAFLLRIEDVTERVLKAVTSAEDRQANIEDEIAKIEEEAGKDNEYDVSVVPMFAGNQFFLFVYEVYRDIRMVAAPPQSIGKFGGDTDNWMWPRHTGDFSMVRIYAGADNQPADYSPDNKPYKPKHYLPVSLKGIKENDFAFIMGYPGSTDRWLSSYHIEQNYKYNNPDVVKLLGERLRIMQEDMAADNATRIKLASDQASLANYYKYIEGQQLGLSRRDLPGEKRQMETKFMNWVNADATRKATYGGVLDGFRDNIAQNRDLIRLNNYMNLGGFGPAMAQMGFAFFRLKRVMDAKPDDPSAWQAQIDNIKGRIEEHFKNYSFGTDQKIFASMNRIYFTDMPKEYHPNIYTSALFKKAKPKGDKDQFDRYAELVYAASFLCDKAKMEAFLKNPSAKALNADPGFAYVSGMIDVYLNKLQLGMAAYTMTDEGNMQKMVEGMMKMDPSKKRYPDANSTMRITYGKVIPYESRDAVSYNWFTTSKGILEKEVPNDDEFHVDPKLHDLLTKKDFGRYGKNGTLVTCFLTDNDITGGNSGSPVMNGDGELIGIAFDGNWEAMTGDLVFSPSQQRTISVDIRYVLFVIDKFAGAKHIVDEMTLRE